MNKPQIKIGIIGLGYVGLPLAVEFDRIFSTVDFVINEGHIDELKSGKDHTLETSSEEICNATLLTFSNKIEKFSPCNVYK